MEQKKTELLLNYLGQQGLDPKVDEEGDIQFEFEGQPLFIHPVEEDRQVLKVFGFAWRAEEELGDEDEIDQELMLSLQVANICTAKHDGVKVIALPERMIVATSEQFYEPFENFKPTFARVLKSLTEAMEEAFQMLEEGLDDEDYDDEDDFDPESN
ncbi:MAG: hypothetical protein ACKO0V_17790 [bacterium]